MLKRFLGLTATSIWATSFAADRFAFAQVPGVSPDFLQNVLQQGGTAALVLFMFWLLWDERRTRIKLEDERVALVKTTLESINKVTSAVADSGKVLERVASGVERLTDIQKDILSKMKVAS